MTIDYDFKAPIPFENVVVPEDVPTITELDNWGVCVNTYKLAIQIVLESLGSRTNDIMVPMSVCSAPEVLAAVLRSGAQPVLLDIDKDTLQLNLESLKEVVEAVDNVVIITQYPTAPELREYIKDNELIDICDTRRIPSYPEVVKTEASFEVWDLAPIINTGGVIFTEYDDVKKLLAFIRSGILGHSAHITTDQIHELTFYPHTKHEDTYRHYTKAASEVGVPITIGRYPLVVAKNANTIIAQLQSYGVTAELGCFPLFFFEEIRERWAEDPEYPNAQEMCERVVALPIHVTDEEDIRAIIRIVKGVM